MKTAEELNTLREEAAALNRKLAELNEEELKQVSGGDMEITVDMIMQYIDAGNDRMAAGYFSLIQYTFPAADLCGIRMAFLSKFGYPIEMYVG